MGNDKKIRNFIKTTIREFLNEGEIYYLREEFKKETGLRTIVEDGMGNSFYTEDYVEWLEDRVKKLSIFDC